MCKETILSLFLHFENIYVSDDDLFFLSLLFSLLSLEFNLNKKRLFMQILFLLVSGGMKNEGLQNYHQRISLSIVVLRFLQLSNFILLFDHCSVYMHTKENSI